MHEFFNFQYLDIIIFHESVQKSYVMLQLKTIHDCIQIRSVYVLSIKFNSKIRNTQTWCGWSINTNKAAVNDMLKINEENASLAENVITWDNKTKLTFNCMQNISVL